jgi:hypothetical protein
MRWTRKLGHWEAKLSYGVCSFFDYCHTAVIAEFVTFITYIALKGKGEKWRNDAKGRLPPTPVGYGATGGLLLHFEPRKGTEYTEEDLGCRGTGVSLLPRPAKRVGVGRVDTLVHSGGCV